MTFDVEKQLKRILKDSNFHPERIETHSDLLIDIYDGVIYQKFFNENSESIRSGFTFSFSLNADGIALCEKSELSITPVILTLNEIPIGQRFCIENVVIAGIMMV